MDNKTQIIQKFLLFASFLILISPINVHGQSDQVSKPAEMGEEAILFQDIPSVFGASKYEQKVTEAPSSVNIVTEDEIKKYGYRNLADILRSISGFYVTYDRNYHHGTVNI